jgi:hypothetical protein
MTNGGDGTVEIIQLRPRGLLYQEAARVFLFSGKTFNETFNEFFNNRVGGMYAAG